MSTTTTISDIEVAVPQVIRQAQLLTITNGEEYEWACSFLQVVAKRKKQVEETFDPIVTKAHAAHKEAVAQKNKFMNPLLQAESAVKGKVSTFRMEQERQRRMEEQRIRDEARKEAEERALQEAAQLEASGEHELADLVIQNATEAPAPVVVLESSVPKQTGISGRTTWKYRIVDELLIPREYLSPDPVKIGAIVRSQKGMAKIAGIEVYPEESVSVRSL